jgi:hypothetical protein
VSQVIALALLGAGLYAGYRWFARTAGEIGAEMRHAEDELTPKAPGRIERDLGALEFDPASGVYRPAKQD